jgi:hypothetical protein
VPYVAVGACPNAAEGSVVMVGPAAKAEPADRASAAAPASKMLFITRLLFIVATIAMADRTLVSSRFDG